MKLGIKLAQDRDLNCVALVGGLPSDLKGRKTMPSKRIYDRDFEYKPSYKTDLSETFRRAREAQIARA